MGYGIEGGRGSGKRSRRKCRQLTSGEQAWLQDVLARAQPALRAAALGLSGDADEAADLAQEAMLRAVSNISRLSPDGRIEPWLKLVARRVFIDRYRHGKHVSPYSERILEALASPPMESPPEWHRFSARDVEQATKQLSATMRAPFVLFLAGVPHREIAQRLGLTPSTVGTRLFRARAKVQKSLRATAAPEDMPLEKARVPTAA